MLEDHQAALETEKDLRLVKGCILLPILLDVLERDVAVLGKAPLKMGTVYGQLLRKVQDGVVADAAVLRHLMRKRGIRVYEQRRTRFGVEARYICRGYHHKYSMRWRFVRAELVQMLRRYFQLDAGEAPGRGGEQSG